MVDRTFRAALFDLDGVVFDTEPVYTEIWREICQRYRPDIPRLEHIIKGKTMDEILSTYFPSENGTHETIREWVAREEKSIPYYYIKGVEEFVEYLRNHHVKTAIVTSSNREKMGNVYVQHPELHSLFDAILTSEDFSAGKPSPDCYQRGAAVLGFTPEECVVFEDSFNGLKSGRDAGAFVIGLSTTNSPEEIAPLADRVIPDFHLSERDKALIFSLF